MVMLYFVFVEVKVADVSKAAKNSPLSLAIAVGAFPDRSLISLALVLAPLIEILVLLLLSKVLPLWEKYGYAN